MALGHGHRPPAPGQVRGRNQHTIHTGRVRPLQYDLSVRIKHVQIEMAMRIDKSGNW